MVIITHNWPLLIICMLQNQLLLYSHAYSHNSQHLITVRGSLQPFVVSIHNIITNVLPGLQSSVLNVLPLPLSRSNVLGKPAAQQSDICSRVF